MVLVLNKVDLLPEKGKLLPLIERYKALHDFADLHPGFGHPGGSGWTTCAQVILERLPEGPAYFPEDYVTDQPERFLAAELVREKVLQATRQEVPHSVAVMVDRWEETPGLTRIYATIRVERPGTESHRHRQEGRGAEQNRHAGAGGNGKAVRREDLSRSARPRTTGRGATKPPFSIRSTGVQWPLKMILKICASSMVLFLLAGICLAADKAISDDAIYDKVRIGLASDIDVKGGNLKVDVKEGVVTLTGAVESEMQKDKAGHIAKKVKGVKKVVNNIEVKKRG